MFLQVLDDVEERSRRLDDAPPPPTVSFIQPPEPKKSEPSAPTGNVTAAYRKIQAPSHLPQSSPVADAFRSDQGSAEAAGSESDTGNPH